MTTAYLIDCMEFMAAQPSGAFDLAIVDPPYGLESFRYVRASSLIGFDSGAWNNNKPDEAYFRELFRVSKRQIIWGANNFSLPETEYFVVWDKQQSVDNFASAEYAWTNCKQPAKVFRYSIARTQADRKAEGGKIHPTQKPVALYEWLLNTYAKPGERILDTHLGSGSSRIAAYNLGFDFTGCEIDETFFKLQEERFAARTAQTSLFV